MINIDLLLPKPLEQMTLPELRALLLDIQKFKVRILRQVEEIENPPALGVSVNETIRSKDAPQ